jgi:hypothetical protein
LQCQILGLLSENTFSPAGFSDCSTLMGHSSIKVTFDTYGHLFADAEADQRAAEGIELRLLGSLTAPQQHGLHKPMIRLSSERISTPWVAGSNPAGTAIFGSSFNVNPSFDLCWTGTNLG